MAAPTCPLHTSEPCSAAEAAGQAVAELRAYKLGQRRWSYNSVEVVLREGGGGAEGRSVAVLHAAANDGVRFAAAHQGSAVGYLLQLDNGAKVQAHVYLCHTDAQPVSRQWQRSGAVAACGGEETEEERFAWSLVARQQCCRDCQGPVLRSIRRFGQVGPRQAKAVAQGRADAAPECAAPLTTASGRKQPVRKDPRFMYLSLDEACTHVGATAFRLVAGIFNRQGTRLLGTAVSPPVRVLANNDAPTGAARIILEATLPSDWEGWSSGGPAAKRGAAAQPARRPAKRPSGKHAVQLPAGLSVVSTAPAAGMPHMQGSLGGGAEAAAFPPPELWQQVQGPVGPMRGPVSPMQGPVSPLIAASQLPLPSQPPSPLALGGGMGPAAPASAAPAEELWATVPPTLLAAHLAPSLPFYSCSQVAAHCEAERQITLLQQLKANVAVESGASASSCSQRGAWAGWGGSSGGGAGRVDVEHLPRWLPGTPLGPASPACVPAPRTFLALPLSDSMATADTTLSAACAAALACTSPAGAAATAASGGLPRQLAPPPAPEPGLGLGWQCSLREDSDLEQLHSLMDDFDDCGLELDLGSIFDDSQALQFAL